VDSKSRYEELVEGIQNASENVSEETYFSLEEQTKKAAANCFLRYGDDFCLKASGFVMCAMQLAEATLTWLLAEGFIELTDKGRASEDEVAKKRTERESRQARSAPARNPEHVSGQYL
jgi:hypothetical protein